MYLIILQFQEQIDGHVDFAFNYDYETNVYLYFWHV